MEGECGRGEIDRLARPLYTSHITHVYSTLVPSHHTSLPLTSPPDDPLSSFKASSLISGLQMAVGRSSSVPLESSASSGRGSDSPKRDARGAVSRAESAERQSGNDGVEWGGGIMPEEGGGRDKRGAVREGG